jgi:predicted phage terminase large subunit-like protein
VLTGFGGDTIIIDDPIKPDQARSDVEREAANEWFRSTLISRLNDKRTGAIILVMQRMHQGDMMGFVQELCDWDAVSLPAIAQQDEGHLIETPFGAYTHRRRIGEALDAVREPLETLAMIERAIGTPNFAAQYLQTPMPPGGGVIKIDWFRKYDVVPPKFDRIIQSWDTASKTGERNDYSVCVTLGVSGEHFFIVNVHRARHEFPDLKAAVKAQAALYQHPTILIEDKGAGMALIQDLKRENLYVRPYLPKGDKVFRMEGQTALLENGFVHIPREAAWVEVFLREMMRFPSGHDDQADALSQGLEHARFGSQSFEYAVGYMRLLLEEREDVEEAPTVAVRHKTLPNMGFVPCPSRVVQRQADGSLLVTETEWKAMRAQGCWVRDDGKL